MNRIQMDVVIKVLYFATSAVEIKRNLDGIIPTSSVQLQLPVENKYWMKCGVWE